MFFLPLSFTGSIYLSLSFFLELFGLFQDCSVLNLFWWPFLPLFHCEKECLSVPGIRRLFWMVFFSCWQYIMWLRTVGNPSANRKKVSIFQT